MSSSRSADGKEERLAMRPGVGRIVLCPGQTAASTLISNDPQRTQPKAKGKEQSHSQTKPRPLERACPLHSLRCCASTTPDLMEAAVATTSSLVLFSSTPRRSSQASRLPPHCFGLLAAAAPCPVRSSSIRFASMCQGYPAARRRTAS